ncbi:hypothetical protein [Devosia neptuniae]|uniref:hypothetical protein n=1 Tax=Devosia neptuniae TaxID=191302 RepID=UPI0022AF9983|nr:hypothetical protein [Devosia neptuniae]MCZ4344492.1 hypothetical protein [Devosia neptuniae]|tara:strand:+ start:42354 stop:44009 length:1656 start_codon:yes stop_codon:yes gene_type:complete
MATPGPYNVGTITVANGSTSIAGTNTFWVGAVRENDMLFVPSQGLMARVTADPTNNAVLAITAWAGTSLVDSAYEVIPAADSTTSAARVRDLLANLTVVEANGRGLFYRFSDSVTDADPGSGYLRLNNATIGTATAAYLDNLDANGATVSAELDTWDDSTSLYKGTLWLRSIADPSVFHSFKITGSVVDATGYRKLTLVYVGGSSTFSADDEMMAFFVPTGDQGDGFVTDAEVADPSGLTALEGEAVGYLVFVTDLSTLFASAYDGRSGVVRLIAGPDWELAALYTGTKGDTGDQGDKGWSPQIVVVSDGTRRVHQLAGYVGGAGTAPTANVGEYLKGDGTFTATIGDAADVRGPAGLNGAGTVASVEAGTAISVDSADATAPIVSAILASQVEAEAGAINNKLMTPLRAQQAIEAAVPNVGTFTGQLTPASSGSITMGNNTGTYFRFGDMVFFTGIFDASSVSSPSGLLTLVTTGLPVSANNNRNTAAITLNIFSQVGGADTIFQARLLKNTADIKIVHLNLTSGTEGSNTSALIKANTAVVLSGFYMVA